MTHTHEAEPKPRPNRRERRHGPYQIERRIPTKNQPATSQCRCGQAFGALTARVAIRMRREHEKGHTP